MIEFQCQQVDISNGLGQVRIPTAQVGGIGQRKRRRGATVLDLNAKAESRDAVVSEGHGPAPEFVADGEIYLGLIRSNELPFFKTPEARTRTGQIPAVVRVAIKRDLVPGQVCECPFAPMVRMG